MVYLQTSVCVLPKTDDHVRRLKMPENDIDEAKGESVILETVAAERGQQDKVGARFKAERDDAHVEFIDKCDDFEGEVATATAASHFTYAELEENDVDLMALQGWLARGLAAAYLTCSACFPSFPPGQSRRVPSALWLWRDRQRQRVALAEHDDRLDNIGISRAAARTECSTWE